MLRSKRNKSIKIAFVLTMDNIRSIDNILGRIDEERSHSILCSDGSSIRFDDIDELFDFPNTNIRRIQKLTITAGDPTTDYASIEFNAPENINSDVIFCVRGEDDRVVSVSNQLEEQILRTKQWYSVVAQEMPFYIFMVWVLGATVLITWVYNSTQSILAAILMHSAANASFNYLPMLPEFVGQINTFLVFLDYTS